MSEKTLANRFDSMYGAATGRGTSLDKLSGLAPNPRYSTPATLRQWYRSNGFIETIVDAPAEDAVKEWILIKTNRDTDDEDSGLAGLSLSRIIMDRLDELGCREKVRDLIRFSRLYPEGGFLFCGVDTGKPLQPNELSQPLGPYDKIDYINVFGPDVVSVEFPERHNPLSRAYHRRRINVSGFFVDESRIYHLVRKLLPEENAGISVVHTVLDPVIAQDSALWSVSTLVYEMATWVFRSPDFKTMGPDKLSETLLAIKSVMSTQSCMGIAEDETIERIAGTEAGKGFLQDVFNFIMENIAGMSGIPKSRLMGQAQGTITAGQYDLRGYYDGIAKFQETDVRGVLEWLVKLVIHERKGRVWEALGGQIAGLDWDITFNPLWREDQKEKAERELSEAQRDQIYIASGVLSQDEVKQNRFAELEIFDEFGE